MAHVFVFVHSFNRQGTGSEHVVKAAPRELPDQGERRGETR